MRATAAGSASTAPPFIPNEALLVPCVNVQGAGAPMVRAAAWPCAATTDPAVTMTTAVTRARRGPAGAGFGSGIDTSVLRLPRGTAPAGTQCAGPGLHHIVGGPRKGSAKPRIQANYGSRVTEPHGLGRQLGHRARISGIRRVSGGERRRVYFRRVSVTRSVSTGRGLRCHCTRIGLWKSGRSARPARAACAPACGPHGAGSSRPRSRTANSTSESEVTPKRNNSSSGGARNSTFAGLALPTIV